MKTKTNNKPLDEVVIEEKKEEPLVFLKEILKPNLGNTRRLQEACYYSES